MRRHLADFREALAGFQADPTVEAFREVQLAGRLLDEARKPVLAKDLDPFGRWRPVPVPSTEGRVR
jgi:hypothetical protein